MNVYMLLKCLSNTQVAKRPPAARAARKARKLFSAASYDASSHRLASDIQQSSSKEPTHSLQTNIPLL